MKTLSEHVEHLRGKPHHVRKRIAFGFALAASGLLAAGWFAVNLSEGTFAIQGNNFATSMAAAQVGVATTSADGSAGPSGTGLAGAAAATQGGTAGPASIEIVDTSASSSAPSQPDQTTIPF